MTHHAAARCLALASLLAISACETGGSTTDAPGPAAPADSSAALDPAAVFARASLDLRGARPTLDELDRLEAEPAALDAMLDGLVEDPRFLRRVKDLFAPAFRTRIDVYPYADASALSQAIGEEPLDLIAWLVANDRPFTDLVLADHTAVSPALVGFWPLEIIDEDGPNGTVIARYTDGRPAAGVLSTNAMWWRHTSTEENANRGRANALSDALLCESYLDRPIAFPRDVDLTDSASIHRAIRENQACAACHATLDPLASHLWGFMYRGESAEAWARYAPAQERDWIGTTERAPAYYGAPTHGLRALAVEIARDERFVRCAVQRVYAGLMARPLDIQDDGAIAEHREVFLASGLKLKALVRSVLDDPAYRGQSRRTGFGGRPAATTWSLVTPRLLAAEMASLTGYRFAIEGRDLLTVDGGLRAVAGGSDRGASTSPSTGLVLVQRRLAEAAAAAWTDGRTSGRLDAVLDRSALDAPPTPTTLQALIRLTSMRAVAVDGPEVTALTRLWADVAALSDARDAWVGLLTALLADPERLLR